MYWVLSRDFWIENGLYQAIPPQLPGLGSRLHALLRCSVERIECHMMQPEFQVFWSWHCDSSARYGGKYHHVVCITADRWVVDSCLLESIQRQGTDGHRTLRLAYNTDKAALIWQFVPYFCGATSVLPAGLCLRLHFLHWRHVILEQLKHLNTLYVKQLAQFVTQFVAVIGSKLLCILIDWYWLCIATSRNCKSALHLERAARIRSYSRFPFNSLWWKAVLCDFAASCSCFAGPSS